MRKCAAFTLSSLLTTAALGLWTTPGAAETTSPHLTELQKTTDTEYRMLPMRDGLRLFTVVVRPRGVEGKAPTILIRTPYSMSIEAEIGKGLLEFFASRGYAIVVQNERGSLLSEGDFHLLGGARHDGYDTLDWIARQSWSNGKVGTMGCSSSGDNQIPLAAEHHPAHAAMMPMSAGTAFLDIEPFADRGGFYRGGVLSNPWLPWYAEYGLIQQLKLPRGVADDVLQRYGKRFSDDPGIRSTPGMGTSIDFTAAMSTLPSSDAMRQIGGGHTDYDTFVHRLPNDPAWSSLQHFRKGDQLGVPGLWIMHQYDIGIDGMMAGFEHVLRDTKDSRVHRNQFAVVGPLGHCSFFEETEHTKAAERPIGDARFAYQELIVRWFDHWLKPAAGNAGDFSLPRVQIYIPGQNRWRSFAQWPAVTRDRGKPWFLDSAGHANSRMGDGALRETPVTQTGSDTFKYDPMYPVPTLGGTLCCVGGLDVQPGAFDQAALELRNDVLVYTSEPLKKAVDTVGWGEAVVHVSSDAPDTDFSVKVVDVSPEGAAYNVGESIQRVRWRNGYDKPPALMRAREVYAVPIGPFFMSNRFETGHRIRVEISSSNFPGLERNLNTGGANVDETKPRVATNTVHHSGEYPSQLRLPVVDAAAR